MVRKSIHESIKPPFILRYTLLKQPRGPLKAPNDYTRIGYKQAIKYQKKGMYTKIYIITFLFSKRY